MTIAFKFKVSDVVIEISTVIGFYFKFCYFPVIISMQ